MASFISKILSAFGGSEKTGQVQAEKSEPETYGKYIIYPTPMKEGGQYRLAGRIETQLGEETRVHNFVRADVFTSVDDAVECTIRKAKMIVDQSGDSIFS